MGRFQTEERELHVREGEWVWVRAADVDGKTHERYTNIRKLNPRLHT